MPPKFKKRQRTKTARDTDEKGYLLVQNIETRQRETDEEVTIRPI